CAASYCLSAAQQFPYLQSRKIVLPDINRLVTEGALPKSLARPLMRKDSAIRTEDVQLKV
ncbi:hypothetical protein PFISCL1PPCAC_17657, partial [Pristionchus fissidentatus]